MTIPDISFAQDTDLFEPLNGTFLPCILASVDSISSTIAVRKIIVFIGDIKNGNFLKATSI